MKRKHDGCVGCPFRAKQYTQVSDFGPESYRYIVVGEGPGNQEAWYGAPFVGPSGKLLRSCLKQNGIHHLKDVYYMNVTQCWPKNKGKNEGTKHAAAGCCQQDFIRRFEALDPVPTLVLGRIAQDALGIQQQYRWEFAYNRWCLAVPHPAAVLQAPDSAIFLYKGVEKFKRGPNDGWEPWIKTDYEVNPYPLPEVNEDYGRICLDIETTGVEWRDPANSIFLLGLYTQRGDCWIFDRDAMDTAEWQAWIRAMFQHHGENIGGHNFKFDVNFLVREFSVRPVIGWDTMLMVNVYHEHWMKDLKGLATYYFDAPDYAHDLVLKHKQGKNWNYSMAPREDVIHYLVNDVVYNMKLYFHLEWQLLDEDQYVWPYQMHEIPQINLLLDVEQRGFVVDRVRAISEQREFGYDVYYLKQAVQILSDGHIENPGSYPQVREYLYNVLKLKPTVFTPKGKPATSEEAIRGFKHIPAVQALLAYRRVSKLKNSYIDNLLDKLHRDKDGNWRVHTTYNAANVVTHRLSAQAPAAQTVPHEDLAKDTIPDCVKKLFPDHTFGTKYSVRIKNLYVAPPGYTLVGVDGMSWEVWTATVQSEDTYLAAIFNKGESPHKGLCDMLYGPDWTKAQKVREKNTFFGWIYMGSASAVAHETGLPFDDVKAVMDMLEMNLTQLKQWRLRLVDQAMSTGMIPVPKFGYHMHFELVTQTNQRDIEKHAVNYVNQGVGSMLISKAAIIANPKLKELGGGVVALVHDAFYAEVPSDKILEGQEIAAQALLEAGHWFSTFAQCGAEVMVGKRWGVMEEV